jgi:hypothetical protein
MLGCRKAYKLILFLSAMIHLIRGNENDLKGKATIYSEFECDGCNGYNINNPPIIAGYLSTDVIDFIEKTNISKEFIDEIFSIKDLKSFFEKKDNTANQNFNSTIKMGSFFGPLHKSKLEIMTSGSLEDIVFTGKYANIGNCHHSVFLGYETYLTKFEDQIIKNLQLDIRNSQFNSIVPKKSYEEIRGDEIYSYLMDNYIIKIMDNPKERNFKNYMLGALVEFGKKSPYFDDIIKIAKILRNEKLQKDEINILDLYMNKITAIHQEKYEEAGKINDVIKNLDKK